MADEREHFLICHRCKGVTSSLDCRYVLVEGEQPGSDGMHKAHICKPCYGELAAKIGPPPAPEEPGP